MLKKWKLQAKWESWSSGAHLLVNPLTSGKCSGHSKDQVMAWCRQAKTSLILCWPKTMKYFLERKCSYFNIWLTFVPEGPIDNISVQVQVMVWHGTGNKPFSDPVMTHFTDVTYICASPGEVLKNQTNLIRDSFDHCSLFTLSTHCWELCKLHICLTKKKIIHIFKFNFIILIDI